MIGVFVQTNTESYHSKSKPVGYVVTESGCWEWVGRIGSDGYGRWTRHVGGRTIGTTAHRALWERTLGPLSDDLDLDHLCRNRGCVRLDHLEPVSRRENVLRGIGVAAIHALKTHCANGHLFDAANTYVNPNKKHPCRACRKCHQDSHGVVNPRTGYAK